MALITQLSVERHSLIEAAADKTIWRRTESAPIFAHIYPQALMAFVMFSPWPRGGRSQSLPLRAMKMTTRIQIPVTLRRTFRRPSPPLSRSGAQYSATRFG